MMPSLQLARRSRAERHRLVLPGGIERGEIVRVGVGLVEHGGDRGAVRFHRRERDECAQYALVGRLALAQSLREPRQDMRGLAQQLTGLGERKRREIFEEQRHEIRQLGGTDREAVLLVLRLEVDHGLAAIAALAVDVLEQVQRQRPRAVEQLD